ncbi:MAG: choice-of-anchor D domain-containing protein, partial [Bacteroidota bacterium]|nr:choice-of-anchor D domain-containing protein [Bacteroidota bacterium]
EDEPYRAAGIRVVAEVPVAVYGVTRYVYTTDAFMVIPVSMLGTEYVIASYPDMVGMYMPWYTNIPSETVIVAAHDNTEVFFTLYGNPITRTSGGMRPGQTKRWTLNKGDVVAIGTVGPEADLSGSLVRATKPVAVVSGNQCTNVPTSIRWCDFTCEMELPTYAWGRTYFVTPIFGGSRFRGQNSVIRIFAKESNTKVYLDGQEWAVIRRGPGGMRGEGWLDIEDPDPAEVRPIVISADKPIQVVQYNKGQESDWIPTDPFEMALPSLEQSQTHVIFATPGAAGGAVAPFGRNFINLVFPLNEDGTVPSDLEFGELRGGQIVWTPVRSRFDPTRVPFRIRVNGRLWAFKVLRLPNTGAFQIRSRSGNFPFMAYSYGGSDYDSYGFVTTMAFGKMLDPADTLPPLVTWSQRCDGFVEGFAVDRPGEASVRSNLAEVRLDPEQSYNYALTVLDQLVPGTTVSVRWQLVVEDPLQPARAVVVFMDRRGNDTCIRAEYSPFVVQMEPGLLDYGLLKVGQWKEMVVRVSVPDVPGYQPMRVTQFRLKDGGRGFAFVTPPVVPFVLEPGQEVEYRVRFTAAGVGSFVDSVGIGDECQFRYITELRARVGDPEIQASDYDYGTVPVGTEVQGWIQVRNSGQTELVITGYRGPGAPGVFKVVNWPVISAANPLVLRPGEVRTLQVNFAPADAQRYTDAIVFSSDAGRVDSVSVLEGVGVRAEIVAWGYDWGRRRVGRGPYDDGGRSGVRVRNVGTQPLTVTDAVPSGPTTGFVYNRGDFVGLSLQPGEERVVPVQFDPQGTGYYQVQLTLQNTTGTPVTVGLRGVGIVPRVRMTPRVDFGTTLVNAPTPNTGSVTVECVEWEFQDDLRIEDIVAVPAGGVGESGAAFGSLGFRYEKAALGLPRVLQPGESVTFVGEFVAQRAGPVQAELRLASDAENNAEAVCVWLGNGITQGLELTGSQATVCAGTEGTLVARVENTGTAPIRITGIRPENATPGATFRLGPAAPATPFDLQPGAGVDIPVVYMVPQAGNYSVEVVVENTSSDRPEVRTRLSVTALFFQRSFRIDGGPWSGIAGTQFWVPVRVEPGADIGQANITALLVRMTFEPTLLGPEVGSIRVGTAGAGLQVVNPVVTGNELRFWLQAQPGQRFSGQGGELVRVLFTAYLSPWAVQTPIGLSVEAPGNACVEFTGEGSGFQLLPVCAFNLRKVVLSSRGYSLEQVHPQPIVRGQREVEVGFSIGMSGETELSVYNGMGERVMRVVEGVLEAGEYRVVIPVERLAPGLYFYRLRSGPYVETRRLVVGE